ncbi:MAG: putative drug exporter of the superfamily [Actinomycetota bacterium]|nr:putative drug exporter of the superfamily [Actinomycetota bacterium]
MRSLGSCCRGLRGRLLIGTLLLLAAGVLVADAAAYLGLRGYLDDRVERSLESLEQWVTEPRVRRGTRLPLQAAEALVPSPLYVALIDVDGELVVAHLAVAGSETLDPPSSSAVSRLPVGRSVTVPSTGEDPGYRVRRIPLSPESSEPIQVTFRDRSLPVTDLVVGISLGENATTLSRLLLIEQIATTVVLGVGLSLATGVLRVGLRPLSTVASTARAIEAGRTDRRISVTDPRTEIGGVALALNAAFDERQRAEDRMRRFVADASHELRTPLSTVRGWTELYLSGGVDDWETADLAMARIGEEAGRMQRLVEQLLLLARLDAADPATRAAPGPPTDVDEVCAVLVEDQRRRGKGHKICLDTGTDGPHLVTADGDQVRQVLGNLVVNAVLHTPPGTAVDVRVRQEPSGVVVRVTDDGPGLDRRDAERMFDRFWRGSAPDVPDTPDARGPATGSGLGLSIARDLVRSHGGDLWIRTAPGQGVCAEIRWPSVDSGGGTSAEPQVGGGRGGSPSGEPGSMETPDNSAGPAHRPAEPPTPADHRGLGTAPQNPEGPGPGDSEGAGPAAWCVRHPVGVIVVWVLLLLVLVPARSAFGGAFTDSAQLGGTQSSTGSDLLGEHSADAVGTAGEVVVHSTGESLSGHAQQLETVVDSLRRLPQVRSVSDPPVPGDPSLSADGRTVRLTVALSSRPKDLPGDFRDRLTQATQPLRVRGLQVEYSGAFKELEKGNGQATGEVSGLLLALIVLLVGFGSVLGAVLPLATAVVGTLVGLSVLGLISAVLDFGPAAPTLATMIGIGVGVDYALFAVTEYRRLLARGMPCARAARKAAAGNAHVVFVAAVTVCVAMLGLYTSGVTFVGRLGLASVITVVTSAAAALTLVPALLGLAGQGIDRWRVRRPFPRVAPRDTAGGLQRYAGAVARRPWWFAAGGTLLLAVLALPLSDVRLGHVDVGAGPEDLSSRRAYDLVEQAFGPGANGTLTVVVDLRADSALDATPGARPAADLAAELGSDLSRTEGVLSAGPFRLTPDGRLLTGPVVPVTGPREAATDRLQDHLVEQVLPRTLDGSGARGYVTGQTAAFHDFGRVLTERMPVIVGVVLLAAFVLILLAFGSPVLALKAILLDLMSIAASCGVVVAVFQWGWGAGLLGVDQRVPVEFFVPMMMFAVVFGLSMDYEIFLLTRVREFWRLTGDGVGSVAAGLGATARVITCAALIMIGVFLSFATSDDVVIKMMALGLAVAVLVDATVVRLMLVPAFMALLGRANWWTPRPLRSLPWLRGTGSGDLVPSPVPAPALP